MPLAAVATTLSFGHGCFPPTLPIGPFASKTFIQGLPIPLTLYTMYLTHVCGIVVHPSPSRLVVIGSLKCNIEGRQAVRILDPILCGDKVGLLGSPKVNIG